MNKKIFWLSAIIMLATLLTFMVPTEVHAAPRAVTQISVTFDEPKANGTPATTASVVSITPNGGYRFTIDIQKWREIIPDVDAGWKDMRTDVFMAGRRYLPVFSGWKNGPDDYRIDANTIITINGTNLGKYGEWAGFGPLAYIPVTEINVTLTEPKIGERPSTTFSITTMPSEALNDGATLSWFESDNGTDFNFESPMELTDTFKDGKYYAVSFSENALKENYSANEATLIRVNDRTVNDDIVVFGPLFEGYTIRFDANGGTGTMEDMKAVKGEFMLPENKFTAPEGQVFLGWSLSSTGYVISSFNVEGDTTVYAIWGSPSVPVTTTQPTQEIKKTNNPKTGDSVMIVSAIGVIALFGIIVVATNYKKTK